MRTRTKNWKRKKKVYLTKPKNPTVSVDKAGTDELERRHRKGYRRKPVKRGEFLTYDVS